MPKKRKQNQQERPRGRRSKGPWLWRVIKFFLTPPVLPFTIIAVGGGFIYWQWESVYQGVIRPVAGAVFDFTKNVGDAFGWGLLLVALAASAVILMFRRWRLSFIVRNLNRWLGILCGLLAVWGLLAFFGLGGNIGLGILASELNVIGALRLAALMALGLIVAFPKATLRALKASVTGLARLFDALKEMITSKEKAKPVLPAEGIPDSPAMPAVSRKPVAPVKIEAPLASKKKREAAPASAPAVKDIKEVAEKVWKDGEMAVGIMVDGWRLPPVTELKPTVEVQFSDKDNEERGRRIVEALASYGVEAKVVEINTGPTVTQFGLEPGWDRKVKEVKEKDKDGNVVVREEEVSRIRVKVDRITSLANDLALALSAPSIRIEAPVPGKSIVGVEVPNINTTNVTLRGVIETSAFQKMQAKAKLAIALGKGAGGETVVADLAKMPHLLIAGSTGSGKTVCLNTIVCCLLLTNTPNEVRFIMIDPKRVELTTFNSIPHLAAPVIVEPEKAVIALRGLAIEMKKRYEVLAAASKRNIESYNEKRQGKDKMPYLVLVIDELADLMMTGGDEVEQTLCRLAQLSRAVGIHLVVATQRPSVDVVTGLIKANFPTRISFAVSSQVDSRTILDMVGAEKLLGRGDMLFMPTDASKPKRLQGCYVSDEEVERLVYFWGGQRDAETFVPLLNLDEIAAAGNGMDKSGHPVDALLQQAIQLAHDHENISTSFLQRRLHIGYPRAARLFEQLQDALAEEGASLNPEDDGYVKGEEEGDDGAESPR